MKRVILLASALLFSCGPRQAAETRPGEVQAASPAAAEPYDREWVRFMVESCKQQALTQIPGVTAIRLDSYPETLPGGNLRAAAHIFTDDDELTYTCEVGGSETTLTLQK